MPVYQAILKTRQGRTETVSIKQSIPANEVDAARAMVALGDILVDLGESQVWSFRESTEEASLPASPKAESRGLEFGRY